MEERKEKNNMRKNLGPQTYLYPMPVLIIGTYDEQMVPNAMNAAWGGISDYHQISISLDISHKTCKNLKYTNAFTVSIANAQNVISADYVGITSGNENSNKIEKAGWHTCKSEFVNAPIITELPMTLECKVISLNEETGILTGEIVNVSVDENILNDTGKIDVKKLNPITYDPVNHYYITLGEVVGNAFKEGKKIK